MLKGRVHKKVIFIKMMQNDGQTMLNEGRTARNVGHNTLNVCQGPKGGLRSLLEKTLLSRNDI